MDCAVSRRLLVLVDDNLPDAAFYGDAAAGGVLDAVDVALDGGLDGAVLQHEVGIVAKGAVHEGEVLAVAKRLFARDVATDERQPLAVPGEVRR